MNLCLESNNLSSKYQSAFPCSHSTEPALLEIFNDLLCYLDELRSLMYIGLYLSPAFDIIDHHILFEILVKRIRLQSVVLLFFENYLSNRSQQVIIIDVFLVMLKLRWVCHKGHFLGIYFFLVTCCFRR